MIRVLWLATILSTANMAMAESLGECEGSPEEAVLKLPVPMREFAVLYCTPYGHILSNREGWIWTYPGAYAPVMIPSQMVQSNPEELGNKSYFRSIEYLLIDSDESQMALDALKEGFDESGGHPSIFRLTVSNQDGKELKLYFSMDKENQSYWGIWCTKQCDPDTRFMMLDMRQ